MEQNGRPASLSVSRGQWHIICYLLKGIVVGLVFVWLAPLVSIAVPGAVVHRDSILAGAACLTRIPEALGRVQEERSRTAAERDAFKAFANRIESMDVESQPTSATPMHGGPMLSEGSSQSGVAMERVRDAYRETVMATPHYHEDYAEPFVTNVAEEFGVELATGLAQGEKLTPHLQNALIEASHTAANERTSYQQTLSTEYDSLLTAKRRLRTLGDTLDHIHDQLRTPETFSALIDAHAQIEDLAADCTRLLENRQATLTNQPQDDHHHHLTEYLYREYPWTYPVLADSLDYHTQLETIKQKAVQSIARHP